MTRLKLVLFIIAIIMLVVLLDQADAYGRRRSYLTSRRRIYSTSRRRSSYRSNSSTSTSAGLVIGLCILGAVLFVVGFVIAYCVCKRQNTTGSVRQPQVQVQAVYHTGRGNVPPPYTISTNTAFHYPTKPSAYPPPGESNVSAYGLPGAMQYPVYNNAAHVPAQVAQQGANVPYPSQGGESDPYYPPPSYGQVAK